MKNWHFSYIPASALTRRFADEGNHMNKVIMARERSLFRPSPDKGVERGIHGALLRARGTGRLCKGGLAGQGVCSSGISFLHDLPPQTPLNPPLSGGKRAGSRFLSLHTGMRACLDRGQSNRKRSRSQQSGESAVNDMQGMEKE
jgi:hypothetical protein